MLALLPTLMALFATAVFAVIAIRSRKSLRALSGVAVIPMSARDEARALTVATRRRMLAATVAGILAAVAVASIPLDHVQTAGALAPGLGGAIGLLVLVISPTPRRAAEGGLRQADLTPRGLATFGPRWGFIFPLVAAALLVLVLVGTGLSAGPDYLGRLRAVYVHVPQQVNSAGPFPGWFYGLPILVATALLVATVLAALHRIAAAPRLGSIGAAPLDSALRAALTRFVMLIGSAVILLYLGAVTLAAGSAFREASQWMHPTAAFQRYVAAKAKAAGPGASFSVVSHAADDVHGVVQPTYTLGAVGAVVGIILLGGAIFLALLALTSLVIRSSVVVDAVEAEGGDA